MRGLARVPDIGRRTRFAVPLGLVTLRERGDLVLERAGVAGEMVRPYAGGSGAPAVVKVVVDEEAFLGREVVAVAQDAEDRGGRAS